MTTRIITDNIADGSVTAPKLNLGFAPIDDISGMFDSLTRTFTLKSDGFDITLYSPYNLDIRIGGVQIYPARKTDDYVNQPVITEFERGFTISGSTITFASAPMRGCTFEGYFVDRDRQNTSIRNRQTPFSAKALMLSY